MGPHSPGLAALTSLTSGVPSIPRPILLVILAQPQESSFWRSRRSRHSGAAAGVVILAQPESPYLPSFAGLRIHSAISAMNGDLALPEGAGGFSPLNIANEFKGL
jgi:hypothetical protein